MNSINFLEGVVETCVSCGLTLTETMAVSEQAMCKSATMNQNPGYVVSNVGKLGRQGDDNSYFSPFFNTYIRRNGFLGNGYVDFDARNPYKTTFLERFFKPSWKHDTLIRALPSYQYDLSVLENTLNNNIRRGEAARKKAINDIYYDSSGMLKPFSGYSEDAVRQRTRQIIANNSVPPNYYLAKSSLEYDLQNSKGDKRGIRAKLNELEKYKNDAVGRSVNNMNPINRGEVNLNTLKQQANAAQAANQARINAENNADAFSRSITPRLKKKDGFFNEAINSISRNVIRPAAKSVYKTLDTSDNSIMSKADADYAIGTYNKMKNLSDAANSYI